MTGEPHPVQVHFAGPAAPDMAALNTSLIPYGRLSDAQIATVLPVEIHWPQIVADRIAVLELYAAGGAPADTTAATIDSVRNVLSQTIPMAEGDIVHAVRLMAAAAIRDDGSRAVTERSTILAAYLESKALAMIRMLGSYVLTTEASIEWGDEFAGLGRAYSPRII